MDQGKYLAMLLEKSYEMARIIYLEILWKHYPEMGQRIYLKLGAYPQRE